MGAANYYNVTKDDRPFASLRMRMILPISVAPRFP